MVSYVTTEGNLMAWLNDLQLEETLNYLKKNIYKALPSTRLESKTDSMAYNRVSVHLVAFKKGLVDGLRTLLDSHHWIPAIDYVVRGKSPSRSKSRY